MIALRCKISPYTGADLCLGIFSTKDSAHSAKENYIATVKHKDPWARQAYHEVDLLKDVELIEIAIDGKQITGRPDVYLISEYSDGFGQIIRKLKMICFSKHRAQEFITQLEDEDFSFPTWAELDHFIVDKLYVPT